jgi:hypothetical protein
MGQGRGLEAVRMIIRPKQTYYEQRDNGRSTFAMRCRQDSESNYEQPRISMHDRNG